MPKPLEGSPEGGANPRKRKSHKKSRAGCGNCKLRRVKCDQGKPECEKCIQFSVCCNYDPTVTDLEPRCTLSMAISGKVQTYGTLVSGLHSVGQAIVQFSKANINGIERFYSSNILATLGPPGLSHIYEKEMYQLILRHPFLMHIALALEEIHQRYLSSKPGRRTQEEIYHWGKGTSLFKQILSRPVHPADRDGIWGAATVLGVITFASVEGSHPEEAWPLNEAIEIKPEWLNMSLGKAAVWTLVSPDRPDSIFRGLFLNRHLFSLKLPEPTQSSLEKISPAFRDLFELDIFPLESNPYYMPALCISMMLELDCQELTGPIFWSHIANLHYDFGKLVIKKDARALLLMAYWYGMICKAKWWTRRRALLEGQSTCCYLERNFAHDRAIQELLEVPKGSLFKYEEGDSHRDLFDWMVFAE